MKKYYKEIIFVLLQLLIFYILPLFAGPTDVMGLIVLIILSTFVLSLVVGILSNSFIKYFYPICVSLIFIPSIYIYYNETAWIHALWYFVISLVGLGIGVLFHKLFRIGESYD